MLFVYSFAIPANTPESSPVRRKIRIDIGVIDRIEIRIPPGHLALARIRVKYGEVPILPVNPGAWIKGDNETIVDEPMLLIDQEPAELTLEGWNEDEIYSHEFVVRVRVVPEEEAKPYKTIAELAETIKKAFGLE